MGAKVREELTPDQIEAAAAIFNERANLLSEAMRAHNVPELERLLKDPVVRAIKSFLPSLIGEAQGEPLSDESERAVQINVTGPLTKLLREHPSEGANLIFRFYEMIQKGAKEGHRKEIAGKVREALKSIKGIREPAIGDPDFVKQGGDLLIGAIEEEEKGGALSLRFYNAGIQYKGYVKWLEASKTLGDIFSCTGEVLAGKLVRTYEDILTGHIPPQEQDAFLALLYAKNKFDFDATYLDLTTKSIRKLYDELEPVLQGDYESIMKGVREKSLMERIVWLAVDR